MGVGVLGPVTVDGGAATIGPRDRIVLSALTTRPGELITAERLADALWADDVPPSWNKVVQGCVVRLRKVLGPEVIETRPTGYRLTLARDEIDAQRFERLVRRGRELLNLGEAERAAYTLDEALALWRGPAFVELEGWDPGRIEAARLDELRLEAEEDRLDAGLRAGRYKEVLADAHRLVAAAPLREHRWALLALAQYQAGLQGEALRTLHGARTKLTTELGIDPGPDLVALEQAILRQDPLLAPAAAAPMASATCPYRGLVPYDVDDAETFFGREADVATCLSRLSAAGSLTIVGPSGSGKSSLLRAGVAAALRGDGHRVVVITPGRHPMSALAVLEPESKPTPILVVDQCEEAVTLCDDLAERARFFAAVAAHADRASLVVALRADRMGDVSAFPSFARVIERSVHLLSEMDDDGLRASIERPARQAGLLLEPGLVELLVRDVEGERGALPLLSHALRETWERREGRTLTVAGYRATGGIRGAVAHSAEEVYEQVTVEQRPLLRGLLLRLVTPTEQGEPVRTPVPRRLVSTDSEHEVLIERLVAARLVTSDEGVVEIAHEALARAWPRLRSWLEEDVRGHRVLRHLTVAADGWEAMGRPDSELYRGVRLAEALEWRDREAPALSPAERAFLDASEALAADEQRRVQEAAHRQARANRRLKALVIGLVLVLIVASVTGLLAVRQADRADDAATIAEARRVAAQALVERPYDRALLLAVEAVDLWESPDTTGNLLTTIERSSRATGVINSGGPRLLGLELSPDKRYAMTTDADDDITLYDLSTRDVVARLSAPTVSYRGTAISPNGLDVAVSAFETSCWFETCEDFAVEVFDARDLSARGIRFEGLRQLAADVAYSPGGDLIAAVPHFAFSKSSDNIAIWRVDAPEEPFARLTLSDLGSETRITPDHGPPAWVSFSPDGTRLYASGAGPTAVFDIVTGAPIRSFEGLGGLALSPDGETLAVATTATDVGLYDTTTGALRVELSGHGAVVTDAAFSDDGSFIATVSNDETAAVWSAATGEQLHLLEGHAGSVLGVRFGAGGSALYTVGADRSMIMWDLIGRGGLARQLAGPALPAPFLGGVALVSPSADTVAVIGREVQIVDIASGAVIALPSDGLGAVTWGAYSPDGRTVVAVNEQGATRLWDVATGEPLVTQPGRGHPNYGAVAFVPDGGVVVADGDGTVTELDPSSLEPTGRAVQVGFGAAGIRATVGGLVAVTSFALESLDSTEIVFADLDTGNVLHRLDSPISQPRANFSPDGTLYALGGFDGRLAVVDVKTGRITGSGDPLHDGPVSWVTFSPESTTLVSIGFDGQVAFSDATTAAPRTRSAPAPSNLRSGAAYAEDGHTLLVAYADGSVVAYETDPAAWVEHACLVAGRNLTDEEWRDAFGDRQYHATCPQWPTP